MSDFMNHHKYECKKIYSRSSKLLLHPCLNSFEGFESKIIQFPSQLSFLRISITLLCFINVLNIRTLLTVFVN